MKFNNTIIIIALIAAALLFMNAPKKETATYVQFRTSSPTYASSEAIAYTATCGNVLTAYGYYSTCGSNMAGECATKMYSNPSCSGATLLLSNLPGEFIAGGAAPSLWQCTDMRLCVCDDNGATSTAKKYDSGDSDKTKVSTSITPTGINELTCTTGTPDCGEGQITAECICQGAARTSGYCCSGVYQTTPCSACDCTTGACCSDNCNYNAANSQPPGYTDDPFCSGDDLYSEDYYCDGVSAGYHVRNVFVQTCANGCLNDACVTLGECTVGDRRCIVGYTDRYQQCMANEMWSGTLYCASGLNCYLGQCCTLINGQWTPYGAWSTCTRTSGCSGTQTQSRTCTNPAPACGGATCSGSATNSQSCTITPRNAADTDCNNNILLSEVITYANKWIGNQGVTLTQVITAADIWVNGGSY